MPSDHGLKEADYNVRSEITLPVSFGKIKKGKWYFKVEQTSGVTTGLYNGAALDLNRGEEMPWYDDDSKLIEPTVEMDPGMQVVTRELIILALRTDPFGRETQSAFCQKGDSGSFVLDRSGDVCGLLYGNFLAFIGAQDDPRAAYSIGLVTSMDVVAASIKTRTGGKLNLV